MPGRKGDSPGEEKTPTTQFSVKLPDDLHSRLQDTARNLGTDRTNLIRMILSLHLPEWEEKAARARPGGAGPAGSA